MQASPIQTPPSSAAAANRAITCFTPGSAITTLNGKINVCDLTVGNRVLTRDRGFQPVRWIGRRQLQARDILDNAPIHIRAGALGPGMPDRDMVMSPRHRVLTTNRGTLRALGETEALVEAAALLGQPGITRITPRKLTYIHVLFDQHEVIHSDNIWSESFHLSSATARALLRDQHTDLIRIFPGIAAPDADDPQRPARACLSAQDWADLRSDQGAVPA